MGNIGNAKIGNMNTLVKDYSVDEIKLDASPGQKFEWTNKDFSKYMGFYKTIPELASTIDTKAYWTVGKGNKAKSKQDQAIIDGMRGFGKDTFNTIMENMVRLYNIGGDAFCEIIREDKPFRKILTWFGIVKPGKPINLKPLNPGRMKIVVNEAGMIDHYEYEVKEGEYKSFKSEDIFHLAWNRIGDEVHGISSIQKVENIVLARNEAMSDIRTVFHRYVKPLWIWSLDTDDQTKIDEFQEKADKTVKTGENIYIPKDAATAERVSVPQYSTLDPLPYIDNLNQYFYQAVNVPDVILGSAKQTVEASAKILYVAFQQTIEKNQLFLEENIKAQLGLEVDFEFPATIQQDLISDAKKDGKVDFKKKDTKLTPGGNK